MIEIKAGAELDAAVAEACGAESIAIEHGVCRCSMGRIMSRNLCANRIFEPSIDTEDAFRAAQKVGLLRMFHRFLSDDEISGYAVYESNDDGFSVLASGETPALAICAAIIKLRENATEGK